MNLRFVFVLIFAALIFSCRAEEPAEFKQAVEPIAFVFPADHASHAGYQTEWWYVTGNLKDETGREFGYQFTIFRRALSAKDAKTRGRTSAWVADDFYLLHLAISDIQAKTHVTYESLERGAVGIAGATDVSALLKERPKYRKFDKPTMAIPDEAEEPHVKVWTKNAVFKYGKNGWDLKASSARIGMNLQLNSSGSQIPSEHGAGGLSRKGEKPGQASYYYSMPKLATAGTLTLDGKTYTVHGTSWMDHEFGSNQLSEEQAGWEWFSIRFKAWSLMLYVLRNKDGSISPSSSGTVIDVAGCSFPPFAVKPEMIVPGRKWKSPHTGVEYVVEWTLKDIPNFGELRITPAMDDQEFHSEQGAGIDYYEGAIRVERILKDRIERGEGYLEVTGKNLGGRM